MADDQAKPLFVDNTNLTELKSTCDEAVEKILSGKLAADQELAPFKVSHFHTDLRLVLGFLAAAVMIGTSIWSYFVEKEWKNNKKGCAIAVVVYAFLSSIQLVDGYLQGYTIFSGTRKTVLNRIETETLIIASPPLPKAMRKEQKSAEGKPILTPPVYTLHIDYARKSNKGKTLLSQKKHTLTLGHMGEWFTSDGEFVQAIFQQRLLSNLQKVFGQ